MAPHRAKALLDANVLFSNQQRNLLLEIASHEIIRVLWTQKIEDEWLRNVDQRIRERILARTLPLMRKHFPDALVEEFELLGDIGSTAAQDRHVASAAIKSAPCTLVTWNVAHFDDAELSKYGVAVQTPDTSPRARSPG